MTTIVVHRPAQYTNEYYGAEGDEWNTFCFWVVKSDEIKHSKYNHELRQYHLEVTSSDWATLIRLKYPHLIIAVEILE